MVTRRRTDGVARTAASLTAAVTRGVVQILITVAAVLFRRRSVLGKGRQLVRLGFDWVHMLRVVLHLLLGLLRGFLFGFEGFLLLAAKAGEVGFWADERAPWVQDRENQEGDHHGRRVEGVGICFVEGDRVGGLDAAREFGDAVDDADLEVGVSVCFGGREGRCLL